MTLPDRTVSAQNRRTPRPVLARSRAALVAAIFLGATFAPACFAQSATPEADAVTIVLPARLVAGQPATLAVLDAPGRLAANVTVTLGGQSVKTDATGRAFFSVPSGVGVMVAASSGISAAALVDAPPQAPFSKGITAPQVISERDQFSVCGGNFRGDADANSVQLGEIPALILAASPECLVVLPSPKTTPGQATIAVKTAEAIWTAPTTIVALEFELPNPPIAVEQVSTLTVRVAGFDSPLSIIVKNATPDVLRFLRGDTQHLQTSGGSPNAAQIEVQAIRSGDFSFRAQLARAPHLDVAGRYLEAAAVLAPGNSRRAVQRLAEKLAKNPGDAAKVRREVLKMIAAAAAGDFHAVLEAAKAEM
jgi:hypothetical protein